MIPFKLIYPFILLLLFIRPIFAGTMGTGLIDNFTGEVILFYKDKNSIIIKQCADYTILEEPHHRKNCIQKPGTKQVQVSVKEFKSGLKRILKFSEGNYTPLIKNKIADYNRNFDIDQRTNFIKLRPQLESTIDRLESFIESINITYSPQEESLYLLKKERDLFYAAHELYDNFHTSTDQAEEINHLIEELVDQIMISYSLKELIYSQDKTSFEFNLLKSYLENLEISKVATDVDTKKFQIEDLSHEAKTQEHSCFKFDSKNPNKINDYYNYQNNNPIYPSCPRDVIIPPNVSSIEVFAFRNKRLTSVTFPSGSSLSYIGAFAFQNNFLTSVIIPSYVFSIERGAFSHNFLNSVVLPDGLLHIKALAFENNFLTSITIPNNVVSIERGAFSHNLLIHVLISESVITIGARAFFNNFIKSLYISGSVVAIGKEAFYNNILISVTIGASITSIEFNAFVRTMHSSPLYPMDIYIKTTKDNVYIHPHAFEAAGVVPSISFEVQ